MFCWFRALISKLLSPDTGLSTDAWKRQALSKDKDKTYISDPTCTSITTPLPLHIYTHTLSYRTIRNMLLVHAPRVFSSRMKLDPIDKGSASYNTISGHDHDPGSIQDTHEGCDWLISICLRWFSSFPPSTKVDFRAKICVVKPR